MQLSWKNPVADDRYVADRAWERAVLCACPFHPDGGCGLQKLGTYGRVSPPGTRVARWWWCPAAGKSVPLSADLEAGFGTSPEAVAETITRAIEIGAAGGNIEDFTGDKRTPLFDLELSVQRLRAAREAIDQSGVPFVLVGRTDSLLVDPGSIGECVRRGNAFREAGADCVFVPGASDPNTIATLVREIEAPLNVVVGLRGNRSSLAELKELGVRRVTIGGSLARAMYHHIRQAALEMMEYGTFTFSAEQVAHEELNQIFEGRVDRGTT